QNNAALLLQFGPVLLGSRGGQGAQFVIAVEEIRDGAWSEDDATVGQVPMDLRDGVMAGVTQSADVGQYVETELMVREGQPSLGLGPEGDKVAWASALVTATDQEIESADALEGRERAIVAVVGEQGLGTSGAGRGQGNQCQGRGGGGAARGARHDSDLPVA